MKPGRFVICPFCDERVSASENGLREGGGESPAFSQVVRCRNCGEAFDAREEYDWFPNETGENFK